MKYMFGLIGILEVPLILNTSARYIETGDIDYLILKAIYFAITVMCYGFWFTLDALEKK